MCERGNRFVHTGHLSLVDSGARSMIPRFYLIVDVHLFLHWHIFSQIHAEVFGLRNVDPRTYVHCFV